MARIMKDSGIKWIGSIPEGWDTCRVNTCFYRKNSKAMEDDPVILSLARDAVKVRDISTNEGQIAESYYNYNPVRPGDLLLNPMDLQSGANCSISKVSGVISPAYVNLQHRKNSDPLYFDYYFKIAYWSGAFFSYGKGVSYENRWTLNTETLMHFPVILPPLDVQRKIGQYIEKKCERIDKVTKKLEKQIEVLEEYKNSVITEAVTKGLNPTAPMKDSGVKWVGKIPENWNIIRGKYILKYLQKPVKEDDGVITCFRDGEVTLRSKRREDGFTISEKEIGYQGIDVGDLVVHGMDGFAGAIGISDSRGKASPVLNVLDTKQNKKYIMYYLRSMAYNDVFVALATGIRVRSCDLRWNKLATLPYVIPPLSEQADIVKSIDIQLEKIKKIISQKQKAIETLNEYKKSLIFEYVTGKKEVA